MVSAIIINIALTLGVAALIVPASKRLPTQNQFLMLLGGYLFWPAILFQLNVALGAETNAMSLWAALCGAGLVLSAVCLRFQLEIYPLHSRLKWSLMAAMIAVFYLGIESLYLSWVDPPKQHFLELALQSSVGTMMVLILFVVVLAPLVEETLFRGLLYTALAEKLPPAATILISGAVFGLVHLEVPALMPMLVILGWILGWLRYKSGSIVPPLILHMVNNALAVLFTMMD